MTNPGFSSWQAMQNANQMAADAARRARQATENSARLARGSGSSSLFGTLVALLILGVIIVVVSPFVLELLASAGF
jgi:predicted lipid-binding transport protein (Tim44 family)